MATRERCGNHLGATRALVTRPRSDRTGSDRVRAARARFVRAVVAALAGALLVAAPARTATDAAAADKSFTFEAWDAIGEVRPDGSLFVTERLTYDFRGGPFNFGIRSFERGLAQVRDFAAADDLGPLTVIAPAESVSGDWEWALRAPTSDAVVTYTLTYLVDDVVNVGRDVADLQWTALGTDHPGVDNFRAVVQFPSVIPAAPIGVADDDTTVVRGFAHGPSNGRVTVETSSVIASVTGVPAGQFVELRAIAPATAFTVTGPENILADVLADERGREAAEQDRENDRRNGWLISSVVAALAALGTGALWLVGGREQRSTEVLGDYWREPLDDPPAVALATLQRGTVDQGHTIAGTLVDMAQRGYVRIVGEREERFGPDKVVHRYFWLGKPFASDVLQYEKDLLELVFRGSTETSSEELTAWASKHQTEAKKLLDEVTGGVKAEYVRRGYGEETRGALVGLLAGIAALLVIISGITKIVTGSGLGWWAIVVAVGLFGLGSRLLSNRNQAAVEAAAKAAGLKKYLKDFSRLEDAPVGHLILWERYLVYAVALGVSADLVRGMALRVPQVVADPSFGVWYVGSVGRFDGFDRIETSGTSLASASTPNNSGSGGGFSGGGGGGFGGGGAGAR
jgi:uncharacterized membrane protein